MSKNDQIEKDLEAVTHEAKKIRAAGYDPAQILRDFWQSARGEQNWKTLSRVARLRKRGVDIEGTLDEFESRTLHVKA